MKLVCFHVDLKGRIELAEHQGKFKNMVQEQSTKILTGTLLNRLGF